MDPHIIQRLESGMRAFLAKHNAFDPAPAERPTATEERSSYAAYAKSVQAPQPSHIEVADFHLVGRQGKIPLRRYRDTRCTPKAVLLYLHGGGWVVGSLDTHNDVCWDLATQCQTQVWAVDYRLAPEHPYPAAFDDCCDVLFGIDQLTQSDLPVIVAGDSAGGNLAAALAFEARDKGMPLAGQALIYPALSAEPLASHVECANAPSLTLEDMLYYIQSYYQGDIGNLPCPVAPLRNEDFSGLAPAYVSVAEFDPLRDDGVVYCERLQAAQITATLSVEKGLTHSFLRARRESDGAADAWQRLCAGISAFIHP